MRGEEANEAVLDLTDRIGADASLNVLVLTRLCRRHWLSHDPGSIVGYVGMPHGHRDTC